MRRFISTTLKLLAWLIFLCIFAVVVVFVGVFHLGFLEIGINAKLKDLLTEGTPLTVTIGDIQGDFFNQLVIQDVTVQYHDGVTSYRMASIPVITVDYSLTDIWHRNFHFKQLKIDSAKVTIRRGADGRWAVPRPAATESGAAATANPSFNVSQFICEGLQFELIDTSRTIFVDSVNISSSIDVFEDAFAFDLRNFTCRSNFHDTRITHAEAKLTLAGDRLVFKDLDVETRRHKLRADGYANVGDTVSGHLDIKQLNVDLQNVGDLVGNKYDGGIEVSGAVDFQPKSVAGTITIEGGFQGYTFEGLTTQARYANGVITADTIYGDALGGKRFDGKLTFNLNDQPNSYTYVGRVQHLDIGVFTQGDVTSDLTGLIDLSGSGTGSRDMVMHINADLTESSVDQFFGHDIFGDVTVTTDSLRLAPGFTVRYFENTFSAAGVLKYAGEMDFRGSGELQDVSRFNGKLFIDTLSGRGQVTFHLTGAPDDPSVSGRLFSDSLWLLDLYSGRSWYDFEIDRFLTRRTGRVTALLDNLTAWDVPIDHIATTFTIDSNIIRVDSLWAVSGASQLDTRATVDYMAEPVPITLSDLDIMFHDNHYVSRGDIKFAYDSLGINVDRAPLENADDTTRQAEKIDLAGRIGFDQSLDLDVVLGNVQLQPWVSIMAPQERVSGALSASGRVRGTPKALVFSGSIGVDSLKYFDLLIGDCDGSLNYARDTLFVDSFTLNSYVGKHHVNGYIPLNLNLDDTGGVVFPDEQNLSYNSNEHDFDFISFFLPQVEEMRGELAINAQISGLPTQPKFNGKAKYTGNYLKIYELEVPAESLYIALSLDDRTITIDSGSCVFPTQRRESYDPENTASRKKLRGKELGHVRLAGDMRVIAIDSIDYNVDVKATNFQINYTLGAFTALADADLNIKGVTPPTIRGDIRLIRALYEEEFLEEDAGYILLSQFERPEAWGMDVNVKFTSNVRVRNTDIDAEFKGDATARRIDGLWYYVYNLEVLRGRLFLPLNTFQLDAGGTVTNNDYAENNPDLNLTARTRMRVRTTDILSESTSKSRQLWAVILVTGTLEEPIISYYDDPSIASEDKVPPNQLYEALAVGYQIDKTQVADVGNRVGEAVANYLSVYASRVGARSLGIETLDIETGAEIESFAVTLGTYVDPRVYTYVRTEGTANQKYGFEWYALPGLVLQGQYDELNRYYLFLNYGFEF